MKKEPGRDIMLGVRRLGNGIATGLTKHVPITSDDLSQHTRKAIEKIGRNRLSMQEDELICIASVQKPIIEDKKPSNGPIVIAMGALLGIIALYYLYQYVNRV